MTLPKKKWTNKKYPTRTYVGYFERTKSDERVLVLKALTRTGKVHKISYESAEAAKRDGWAAK